MTILYKFIAKIFLAALVMSLASIATSMHDSQAIPIPAARGG